MDLRSENWIRCMRWRWEEAHFVSFFLRPQRLPRAVFIIQIHNKLFFSVVYEVQITPFIKQMINYFNVLLPQRGKKEAQCLKHNSYKTY